MMNSFGSPQTLLLVGSTSEIGLQTVFEIAKDNRLIKVIVTAKSETSLIQSKKKLEVLGINIEGHILDLENINSVEKIITNILISNQIDICLLAAGHLPDNLLVIESPSEAVRTALINFVGPLAIGTTVMNYFSKQGFGSLVVYSTVAALRPRKDVIVYGASKSALDFWANGYADLANSKAIKIFVVRSGMVRTKMTKGLKEVPFTSNPIEVAKAIKRNLYRKQRVIWVPIRIRFFIFIFLKIPRVIFKRIKIR